MRRKVNKIGPATLMVSLPAKWVKEHNIKKGDEIEISESEGKLIVGGEGEEQLKKTIIDLNKIPNVVDASDNFYRRLFSNAYKRGYDEIEVIFPDKNVFYKIAEATKNLMGYEIFDQTDKKCIIKSLANERFEEFERLVRKSFLIVNQAADITYQDIKTLNLENRENIQNMRSNVQKLTDFCRRLINKRYFKNSELATYYYIILMRLIFIMVKFDYIYDYLEKEQLKKLNKETVDFFKKTVDLLHLFYETFYQKDIRNLDIIDKKKQELVKTSYKLLTAQKGPDNIVIFHLAEIVRIIYDNSSQLMGIIL